MGDTEVAGFRSASFRLKSSPPWNLKSAISPGAHSRPARMRGVRAARSAFFGFGRAASVAGGSSSELYPLRRCSALRLVNSARQAKARIRRSRQERTQQPRPAGARLSPSVATERGEFEPTAPTRLALPDKPSIAVLPFQNVSGDLEQEYFADGWPRTSSPACRGSNGCSRSPTFELRLQRQAVDARQVGRQLGVRYVLEGGVRKARDLGSEALFHADSQPRHSRERYRWGIAASGRSRGQAALANDVSLLFQVFIALDFAARVTLLENIKAGRPTLKLAADNRPSRSRIAPPTQSLRL